MNLAAKLEKFKPEEPISQRLCDWMQRRTSSIHINPSVLDNQVDILSQNPHNLIIYTGNCMNTIYGDPKYNILFRAWHDQLHILLKLGFSLEEEITIAYAQISELPEDWYEEKLLILTDIIPQHVKFNNSGKFPENQRDFIKNILKYKFL